MQENPNWKVHNQLVKIKVFSSSQALQKALKHADEQLFPGKFAADLGCGAGSDTVHLLKLGFTVLAIDKDGNSVGSLAKAHPGEQLIVSYQTFEQLQLPHNLDLVNASFAIPFCHPDHFSVCWQTVTTAIKPGGYFSGHFFGRQDSWAAREDMTFHSAEEIQTLFADFEILWQEETEKDGKTLGGTIKHWHVFHIAARKLQNALGN